MTHETSQMSALEPLAVPRDEGEARWWFGTLAVIKTTAAETGGQLTIIDITNPPGWEAPLHVHHRDDEGFWILEGSATVEVGDRTIEASAGDYLFGPRDIPHRYTVGDSGCRMLFIMVPGGMEDVVRATSEPAASRTLPPPPDEEPDIDAIKEIVKQHGYELLVYHALALRGRGRDPIGSSAAANPPQHSLPMKGGVCAPAPLTVA